VRWILIAVLVWLALLTVLTLIALFRHSTSSHSGQQVIASPR
jgi:flagellar basal body-associated protein FliL